MQYTKKLLKKGLYFMPILQIKLKICSKFGFGFLMIFEKTCGFRISNCRFGLPSLVYLKYDSLLMINVNQDLIVQIFPGQKKTINLLKASQQKMYNIINAKLKKISFILFSFINFLHLRILHILSKEKKIQEPCYSIKLFWFILTVSAN